jgi:hypothetical protein
VGDLRVIALEQVLIDPIVLVKQPECRFQTFGQRIDRSSIKAFIIHAANFEDHAQVTGLGEKDLFVEEAIQIYVGIQCAGFFIVLEDSL